MQLVIEVSDGLYNNLGTIKNGSIASKIILDCVRKGKAFPKGQERIIDANIIKDFKNKIKHYEKDYKFTQEEILNILERYEIKYATTIIKADKENNK